MIFILQNIVDYNSLVLYVDPAEVASSDNESEDEENLPYNKMDLMNFIQLMLIILYINIELILVK